MVRVIIVDNHVRRGWLAKSYYEAYGYKPTLVTSIGAAAREMCDICPNLVLLARSLSVSHIEAGDDFSLVRLNPEALTLSMVDAYLLLAYGQIVGKHCGFSGPFVLN